MKILEVGDDPSISHMKPLMTQYLHVEYGFSFVESQHKALSLTRTENDRSETATSPENCLLIVGTWLRCFWHGFDGPLDNMESWVENVPRMPSQCIQPG